MFKRKNIVIFLCVVLYCLCGCSKISNQTTETKNIESLEKTEQVDNTTKKESLRYVDAWGEWHETVINPKVEKNEYNWNHLTNDGQTVSLNNDDDWILVNGIDVSYHQGNINWQKVKADGIDFAFVRIAYRGYGEEGNLQYDKMYQTNLINAKEAGIARGVYIFSQAINEEEAIEEAKFVIEGLKGENLELPVVFDPELIRDDDARTDHVTGEQFTKNAIAFCKEIEKNGYQPMIYSNMIWEADLFSLEELSDIPIWYADYEKTPQTPYKFTFWQYTEKGKVDGVAGEVDRNVWFQKK